MAALNFTNLIIRRPAEFAGGNTNLPKPVRQLIVSSSSNSAAVAETPKIELEFIGPKVGGDGKYPVDRTTEISGEKVLRSIMADNKIELYAPYGKVMNCGGGGSCGTCIVETTGEHLITNNIYRGLLAFVNGGFSSLRKTVIDGKDLLSERTNTELKYLKKKPESWRLACQTIVGNKENSGKVVIQRLPQWKK